MKYAAGCTAKRIPASYAAAVRAGVFRQTGEIFYIGAQMFSRRLWKDRRRPMRLRGFPIRKTRRQGRELIEHNLRLVVYIAQKFDNTGVGVEDLISIWNHRPHQGN